MLRRLLSLVIFAAFAYAGWNVAVVWFHYREFQDAVRDTALFAEGKSDDALTDRVMQLATDNDVPLDPNDVTIQRGGGRTTITASYTIAVKILPGYTRQFDFTAR